MTIQASFSIDPKNRVVCTDNGLTPSIRVIGDNHAGSVTIYLPFGTTQAAAQKIVAAIDEALAPRREEIAQKIRELV